MNDELIGIALIVAFVFVGIISGGKIFDFNRTKGDSETRQVSTLSDRFVFPPNSSNRNFSNNSGIRSITQNVNTLSNSVQTYIEGQNASVYKGRVDIAGISKRGTFEESVVLRAHLEDDEIVNISNWKLRSTITGNEILITGGAEIPYPNVRDTGPIELYDNDKVIVTQNRSPIGTSFRTNICMGYFDDKYNFDPPVSSSCPRAIDDIFIALPDDCVTYLKRINRCSVPKEIDYPEDLPGSCKTFIKTHLNYNYCVQTHKYDSDFYGREWRVYGGNPRILWREKQEHIQLLDSAGKVVDSITY